MATQTDQHPIANPDATDRYFAKFSAITGHLARVAGVMESEARLDKRDVEVLARYITALRFTFQALGHKEYSVKHPLSLGK